MPNPGSLRFLVTIEKPKETTATLDDAGAADETLAGNWQTHCKRRAEIIETGGREYVQRRRVAATTTHLIRLRADRETVQVGTAMRFKYTDPLRQKTRTLNISQTPAYEDMRRRWLVLEAIEAA